MPVILYNNVESPPCAAVLITAKAIDLRLTLKNVDLSNGEHKLPEYIKINPQHTIPTLDDNGVIIADSHAIAAYLVSKYGKDESLYPKDLVKRAIIDWRLHFDSAVAFAILKSSFRAHVYEGQTEYLTQPQTEKILDVYNIVNSFLSQTKWIAGDSLTIADIALVSTVSSLEVMLAIDDSKYPNVRPWLNAATALPFFAVNKAGTEEYRKSWNAASSHAKY